MSELYATGGSIRKPVEHYGPTGKLGKLADSLEFAAFIALLATGIGTGLMVFAELVNTGTRTVAKHTATSYSWQDLKIDHGFFTVLAAGGWPIIGCIALLDLVIGIVVCTLYHQKLSVMVNDSVPREILTVLGLSVVAAMLSLVLFLILSLFGVVSAGPKNSNVNADMQHWLKTSISNPPQVDLTQESQPNVLYGYDRKNGVVTTYEVRISEHQVTLEKVR